MVFLFLQTNGYKAFACSHAVSLHLLNRSDSKGASPSLMMPKTTPHDAGTRHPEIRIDQCSDGPHEASLKQKKEQKAVSKAYGGLNVPVVREELADARRELTTRKDQKGSGIERMEQK
jgi:hypothetical protein